MSNHRSWPSCPIYDFLHVHDGACTLLDKLLSSLVVDEIEA